MGRQVLSLTRNRGVPEGSWNMGAPKEPDRNLLRKRKDDGS